MLRAVVDVVVVAVVVVAVVVVVVVVVDFGHVDRFFFLSFWFASKNVPSTDDGRGILSQFAEDQN